MHRAQSCCVSRGNRVSIEDIQCVKCGATLEVGADTTTATCGYSGSTLCIARGSSGHLVATLEAIQDDLKIIATRATLQSGLVQSDDNPTERGLFLQMIIVPGVPPFPPL